MKKRPRFYKIRILLAGILAVWCFHGALPSYAEDYYIAESFGLHSKGIEYYHAGKLYEAKKILERALELDPRNDEAQGYLDLVNSELRMRAKGKLNFYQSDSELEREADLEEGKFYVESEHSDYYEPEEESYDLEDLGSEYRYFDPEIGKEWPDYTEDKIKAITDELNNDIYPAEIKGEYKMSLGATSEDLIWKNANGDYNERNFRMIDHNFPKTNTFDTRVYDRFKVAFDTNKDAQGLNFHSDITVDPWSFVGKTEKFTVGAGNDKLELELKYWSGTRSIINETLYTLDEGDSVNIFEHKVTDGSVPAFSLSSTFGNTFTVPEQEIDFTFQPVRELWFDYSEEDYKLKIFPFGLEDQALSSDDPLGLSNHHIYWEPSPWLDDWVPGHINTPKEKNRDFWKGQWSDDLSFFTRDSDLKRLTALRGFSFEGDFGNTDVSMTVASPKGLWQDYTDFNALPGAVRLTRDITDGLTIGLIDTFRIGHSDGKTDSYNNVFGVDAEYDLNPTINIVAEVAMSKNEDDRTSSYKTEKNGTAAHIAIKKETPLGDARIALTHMDEAFDPGLSSYKETRKDQHWGRHIHFKKPLEGSTTLKYEDVEPFRIGDGIDSGRKVASFRLDTKETLDKKLDNLIDYRYVRDSEHKYVEGVFREENTFRINPEWTSKLLFIYHDLPKTKGGVDPIYYDSDTGEYVKNSKVEDGKDPSLSTYSLGFQYAPEDWISIFGIYENTNDFTFATGNNPRGLLNDFNFTTEAIERKMYREKDPYLNNQDFFDLPPYKHFNIYRTGISLRPSRDLGIDFDYTKNDFKFASGIDSNINHFGTSVKYRFTPKLAGFLKYTFSKAYNLYRLNTSGDLKYEDHHNVFMELDYNVTEYGLLTIQFGEGSVVSPVWGASASPFGDFYPTLDTQHILRIYYKGEF